MRPNKRIKVNGPIRLNGAVNIPSALDGENADKEGRFEMLAYTGAAVEVGFGMKTVFDLSDMNIKDRKLAILLQHDPDRRIGFGEEIENTGVALNIKGKFLDNENARQVIADSKQGYPWQASVGLNPDRVVFIDDGVEAEINGQMFTGPLLKVSSTLRESSFVSLGADGETSAFALSAAADFTKYELEVEMAEKSKEPTVEPKGASPKELRAAFPNDLEFVFECIEASLTIDQAKLKYLPIIQAQHEVALKAQQASFEAKLEAQSQSNPPVRTGSIPGSETLSASQNWRKQVQAELDRGHNRPKAVSIVAKRNPALNKAMVLEANEGRRCYVPHRFES